MKHEYIDKLIGQGEGLHLDFKFAISDSRKIARSFSAFANTDGGRLLVGVKDNGRIAGVRCEEEVFMLQSAAQMYCVPEVRFEIVEWNIEGKRILEVIIPKSKRRPHYAVALGEKTAYVRVGDQNHPVNKVLLKVWKSAKQKRPETFVYSRKEKILLEMLEREKKIVFEDFLTEAHLSVKEAEDVLVKLILFRIVGMEVSEKDSFYFLRK